MSCVCFAPFDGDMALEPSQISSPISLTISIFFIVNFRPPPEEVYTLHRKLAGAYMLCIKLGAIVHCRGMLEDVVANHVFEDGMNHPMKN